MPEASAIPNALERRNLVEARSLTRLQCKIWIRTNRSKDVGSQRMVFRRRISGGQRQLVVGVERWCMASGTLFAREYFSTEFSASIFRIRILRRFQGEQILRQREEHVIGKPSDDFPAPLARNAMRSEIGDIATRDQRGIAHQIGRATHAVGCRMVDVPSVSNADKVRYLRRVKRASIESGDNVSGHSEFLNVGGSH